MSAAAMMLGTMSEQTEPPERTTNRSPEHLTFAEAAERLNITPDAVRMRVHRGKLASVRVNERTFVVWPQPETGEHSNEPRTERTGSANRSDVQSDARLVKALEDRIESLERQLEVRDEEIRRRDHLLAGLIEWVPELPAGTAQEAPMTHERAPQSGDVAPEAPEGLLDRVRRLLGR